MRKQNWQLTKRPQMRGVDWPRSWQRALLAALMALPSLTPEEFAAGTSKHIQEGLKRSHQARKAAVAATTGGSNGVD